MRILFPVILAALLLGSNVSDAAETLTPAQMSKVTAGGFNFKFTRQFTFVVRSGSAVATNSNTTFQSN